MPRAHRASTHVIDATSVLRASCSPASPLRATDPQEPGVRGQQVQLAQMGKDSRYE